MKKSKKILSALLGTLVGFIGGFFGGGGGMAAVPLLEHVLKVPTKKAHATTMLIILPMSAAAFITYYLKGTFEAKTTIVTAIGVLIGGIVGAHLLKKLNSSLITIIFAVLMIIGGLKMIF